MRANQRARLKNQALVHLTQHHQVSNTFVSERLENLSRLTQTNGISPLDKRHELRMDLVGECNRNDSNPIVHGPIGKIDGHLSKTR